MSLIKRLLGLTGADDAVQRPDPDTSAPPDVAVPPHGPLRDQFWARVGVVEPDVLTHLISPSFTGGPDWPSTRQAFHVVRRGDSVILATDGLSDEFDARDEDGHVEQALPNCGFEMELFIETADIPPELRGAPGDISPLSKTWAFEILKHVAELVADAGGITGQLDRYGVLSVEFPGVSDSSAVAAQVPPEFVTEDDCVGLLIGGPAPDFPAVIPDMPGGAVRMVPVVLITASELEAIRAEGGERRKAVVQALADSPTGHRSALGRAAVA